MIKYELKWAKYALYCIVNKGIKEFTVWGGGHGPQWPPGSASALIHEYMYRSEWYMILIHKAFDRNVARSHDIEQATK
jgi:hypothetical protein